MPTRNWISNMPTRTNRIRQRIAAINGITISESFDAKNAADMDRVAGYIAEDLIDDINSKCPMHLPDLMYARRIMLDKVIKLVQKHF